MFWSAPARREGSLGPATRLTQRHKRVAKGVSPVPPPVRPTQRENICRECGNEIRKGSTTCLNCSLDSATIRMIEAAQIGRLTASSPAANAKRAQTQRQNALAQHSWNGSMQPDWLTGEFYANRIQPLLAQTSASVIARQIEVSRWYAGRIREGYRPHARHWRLLAELVGISPESDD